MWNGVTIIHWDRSVLKWVWLQDVVVGVSI